MYIGKLLVKMDMYIVWRLGKRRSTLMVLWSLEYKLWKLKYNIDLLTFYGKVS